MRSDSESGPDEKSTLERRSYIKLTGAVVGGSVLGATQIGRASGKTRHGITFDNVVDAVNDLGCDPNGNKDVTGAVESALDGQTLVEFPSGTYRWEGTVSTDLDRIGIRGKADDVRFTFPSGYNDFFINTTCDQAVFENFDVDLRADQAATGIRIDSEHGFHAENIEHIGRAIVDSDEVTRCWQVRVNDANSTGVLKNFVAKKGSAWAHYKSGDGRVGISVYGGKGTVKVVNCHLEEFGNNGIYGSRTLSAVQIIGGTFRNNNVASVRISGDGSYVEGATIEIDPDKYSGPHTLEDDSFTMRGVLFEQGNASTNGEFDKAGGEIRNTEITVKKNPTTGPAVAVWTGGRTLNVKNTQINYNNDGAPAVHREKRTSQGRHDPSPDPRWLRMNRVEITGSASNGPSVLAGEANGSKIQNSYIEQSGSGRQGVVFSNSGNTLVKNTTIKVNGKAVQLKSSSGKSVNVSKSGSSLSLDVGNSGSSSKSSKSATKESTETSAENTSNSDKSNSNNDKSSANKSNSGKSNSNKSNDGKSNSGSNGESQTHTLEIEGSDSKADYTLAVDGEIEPNEDLSSFECTVDTFIGENWASGSVDGTLDKFLFTGSVTSFTTDGDLTVRVDGSEVDPKTLGENNKQHTLIIDGSKSNGTTKYALSVNGSIEKGDLAESSDTVSGSTARGTVAGKRDSFQFSGQITEFDVDGDASISFGSQ